MNVTIFATGKGGSESAVNYLLSDTDYEKKKRSVLAEIICGDPQTFVEIANSTSRKHKYTSGVVAFRDDESLTPEQITTVIDAFRSTFLPGLKADENFADFWVMHRDKENLELHFLVANTELSSGSQLNIHPPGQKNIQFFNAFSAVMNDTFGFAQVVPDPLKISLKPFEAKSPNGKKDKKAKDDFAKVLHAEILGGTIGNRNQLIGFLKKHGVEIPRIGDDYLTVRLPGRKQNTRLKGPLFAKGSDYAELVKQHHASKIPKFLSATEAQDQRDKLTAGIEARAAFNQRRYLDPKPGAARVKAAPNVQLRKTPSVGTVPVAMVLAKQLRTLKSPPDRAAASVPKAAATFPHQVARQRDQSEREGALSSVMGASALGGIEAQIGSLSLQYHTLLLLLAGAKGSRATKLRAQIIALEQKLSALNLELQKKKIQAHDPQKPKI